MRQSILPKVSVAVFALMIAIASLSCSSVANSKPSPIPRPKEQSVNSVARPVNPKLIAANTQFGFKLFSEILKKNKQDNIFVSPSSVAIALSMTYNGAEGETKAAMAKALQLQGLTIEELNRANANLKASLEKADPSVQLAIANSLWADRDISFNPDFMQRNRTFYNAEVTTLSFADPATPQRINSWVNQKTRGKINQIVDRVSPDQAMFLINAIYFKGQWTEKFEQQKTQERPFFLANGSQKRHPLMQQNGKYRYYETDQFQAVSLPYGKERLSFYVFLPKEKLNLSAFYKNLTAENWQTWMQSFSQREGSIQLPKFKLSYDVDLKDALSALGMATAFDASKADFSKLSSATTKIDQVKHKTFVEVNEEGTEAAAVTSVGIVATSVQIEQKPFEMIVNRPFFCAIRDNQTGEILFMGAINNPRQG